MSAPFQIKGGATNAVAGLVLCALAWSERIAGPPGATSRAALLVAAAALFLAAAGLLSAGLARSAAGRDWPQFLATGLLAAGAVAAVLAGFRLSAAPAPPGSAAAWVVTGGLAVIGLIVVYLERTSAAGHVAGAAPSAPVALLRVAILGTLSMAAAAALSAVGFEWSRLLPRLVGLGVLAVAAELWLRAGAQLFLPRPEAPRPVAVSSLAGLLRRRNAGGRLSGMPAQLGIDLAQSWALGFLRRTAPFVLAGVAVLAWLLSGVVTLGASERAIYQRLGVPVAVFGPGLHVGLPWPLGTVRLVEYGVVHDLPVLAGAGGVPLPPPLPGVGADDPPPPDADRLWDRAHPTEARFLVASEARGRQNFEVVDIDLRLVYRIGLTDADAMAVVYRLADPPALLRAVAGELLARSFASATLLGVIGDAREAFVAQFEQALRERLARLGSGIDLLAVIVEGIHPPPSAAAAYHDVQAAGVRASTSIADQQAAATRTRYQAQQKVTTDRDAAQAAAREIVGDARVRSDLFAADRQAERAGGAAFLTERWFDRLRRALGRSQVVIIDHRLADAAAATIDMRALAPPSPPP